MRRSSAEEEDGDDSSEEEEEEVRAGNTERFLPGELGDCQMRRAEAALIRSLKSQLLPMPALMKHERFLGR